MRPRRIPAALRALAAALAIMTLAPPVAHAEKADKNKPKQLSPYKLAQMQGGHAASPFTTPPVKKP